MRHGETIIAIAKDSIAAARKAGKEVGPCAVAARYRPSVAKIEVEFNNGVTLAVPANLIQGLAGASTADLSKIEITPAGLGLHFARASTPTSTCQHFSKALRVQGLDETSRPRSGLDALRGKVGRRA